MRLSARFCTDQRDPSGNFSGIIADAVSVLANDLGAVSEVIPYDNPTRFNLSLGKHEWDVAFMPRDLSELANSRSRPALLWRSITDTSRGPEASLAAVQDVDRTGIKVGVTQGSPTAGFLARNLKTRNWCGYLRGFRRRRRHSRLDAVGMFTL